MDARAAGYFKWAEFTSEFERLRSIIAASDEAERNIVTRCEEIRAELVDDRSKLGLANRVRQEDQKMIAQVGFAVS